MPGRKFDADGRYGFNGKERDKDINSLTAYDYGFRIYNPAIGKFLSVDPLTRNYPSWSPYPFAMNRPIDGIDLDGLEYLPVNRSIISIYIEPFTFESKTVVFGSVSLNFDKTSSATQTYIKNVPWEPGSIGSNASLVASFSHKDYSSMSERYIASTFKFAWKEPEMEDVADEVHSLKQSAIKLATGFKQQLDNFQTSQFMKPAKLPKEASRKLTEDNYKKAISGTATVAPTGVFGASGPSGQQTGDAIMAAVAITTWIIENHQESLFNETVKADFNTAKGQLSSVKAVVSNIQFAFDQGILSASLNQINGFQYGTIINGRLSEFANYLLDGRVPTREANLVDKDGKPYTQTVIDITLRNAFDAVRDKINARRTELAKTAQ